MYVSALTQLNLDRHNRVSTTDTRLLSQPAASATHVAFAYGGDLWSARLDGGEVRRLTSADGDETSPVFSRDGRWIAFAGNYDGNVDVYVVPATGGRAIGIRSGRTGAPRRAVGASPWETGP